MKIEKSREMGEIWSTRMVSLDIWHVNFFSIRFNLWLILQLLHPMQYPKKKCTCLFPDMYSCRFFLLFLTKLFCLFNFSAPWQNYFARKVILYSFVTFYSFILFFLHILITFYSFLNEKYVLTSTFEEKKEK